MIFKGYSLNRNITFLALVLITGMCLILTGCTKSEKDVDEAELFEKSFTEGTPDPKVKFPEDEFARAKELRNEKKPDSAEKILLSKLDAAKKSAVGTTKLGKYLVRLNNVLYDQGDFRDAITYGEIALKIFYAQPLEKRPLAPWFVNIHTYLAWCYEAQTKFDKAEEHFLKAIQFSSSAPKAEVSDTWMKLLYMGLARTYKAQDKKDKWLKVHQHLFDKYKVPMPVEEKDKSLKDEGGDKDKNSQKGKNNKQKKK